MSKWAVSAFDALQGSSYRDLYCCACDALQMGADVDPGNRLLKAGSNLRGGCFPAIDLTVCGGTFAFCLILKILPGCFLPSPLTAYTVYLIRAKLREKYHLSCNVTEVATCLFCPCVLGPQILRQLDGGNISPAATESDEDWDEDQPATWLNNRRKGRGRQGLRREIAYEARHAIGTDSAMTYKYGYVLGWPSGFPSAWFEQVRSLDPKVIANHILEEQSKRERKEIASKADAALEKDQDESKKSKKSKNDGVAGTIADRLTS